MGNPGNKRALHEATEVIRLKIMKGLELFPERELEKSFMTREKSSPEDINVVVNCEYGDREKEIKRE